MSVNIIIFWFLYFLYIFLMFFIFHVFFFITLQISPDEPFLAKQAIVDFKFKIFILF